MEDGQVSKCQNIQEIWKTKEKGGTAMNGRLVTGLTAVALIGAGVGLLVAPKPGKDTREIMRCKTGQYFDHLRNRLRRDKQT